MQIIETPIVKSLKLASNSEFCGQQARIGSGEIELLHVSELFNLPSTEMEYVVDGLLLEGSLSILAARPKCGKSTFAIDLCHSVVSGEVFLGQFNTTKGMAWYFALEELDSVFAGNLQKRGFVADHPFYARFLPMGDEGVGVLRNLCISHRPRIVVIDHLSLFQRIKDINDYTEMQSVLSPIRQIARESGAHIMLLHHMNKSGGGQRGILGSTSLSAGVDTILVMEGEAGSERVLNVTQRYGQELTSIALSFDPISKQLISRSAPDAEGGNLDEVQEVILKKIENSHIALGQTKIFEGVRARQQEKYKALNKLVDSGRVLKTGTGKRGDEFKFKAIKQGNTEEGSSAEDHLM